MKGILCGFVLCSVVLCCVTVYLDESTAIRLLRKVRAFGRQILEKLETAFREWADADDEALMVVLLLEEEFGCD